MAPTAMSVLNTTELLEKILLQIPPQEIFLDQRVCRKWRDVIRGSIHLRRMLFLEPISTEMADYLAHGDEGSDLWIGEQTILGRKIFPNPLMNKVFDLDFSTPELMISPIEDITTSMRAQSWRGMFLTHPRCKLLGKVAVFEKVIDEPTKQHYICEEDIRCDGGVTMGKLVDSMRVSEKQIRYGRPGQVGDLYWCLGTFHNWCRGELGQYEDV